MRSAVRVRSSALFLPCKFRKKQEAYDTKNSGRRPMKITGADHTNWQVRDLERSLGFYPNVLGLEPFGLEEFNRCSRSPGNSHVEELQTIAHEGGIFLTAVRLCSEARSLF